MEWMEHDGDNHRLDLAPSLKHLSAVGVKYNKADSNLLRTRATHPDFITHLVTAVLEISQHLEAQAPTDLHNPMPSMCSSTFVANCGGSVIIGRKASETEVNYANMRRYFL